MAKESLRAEILARRSMRGAGDNAGAGSALAAHCLGLNALARAERVAAYVSMPSEPATHELIDGLMDRGCDVIIPITRDDGTLDWVVWERDAVTSRSALGTTEPDGERVGPHALRDCDLIFVPALAVDQHGYRLGRGGGYYDRALADVRTTTAALLFDEEIVPELPHQVHDVRVDMAICPTGVFRILS